MQLMYVEDLIFCGCPSLPPVIDPPYHKAAPPLKVYPRLGPSLVRKIYSEFRLCLSLMLQGIKQVAQLSQRDRATAALVNLSKKVEQDILQIL